MRSAAWVVLLALASMLSAPPVRAQTQVLIVTGLGGAPKYSAEFAGEASQLAGALHTRYGVADSDIVWLGEAPASREPHYGGRSTAADIERTMRRMAARARPGAEFVLVLIGHGDGSAADSRIDLPGPDLTAADFERLLAPFAKQRVAVLDLTSASGDALAVLSAPDRVVITATKTSYERNETHFGGFFIDALTKGGADTDKDGRVSLLEAFQYAQRETARFYENDERLRTEHAQLSDLGNGKGTGDPSATSGNGMLAARYFLDAGTPAQRVAANNPKLAALYARRFALTDSVQALEARKDSMPAQAYQGELQRLLLSLAQTGHAIRALEGPSSPPGGGGGR